MEKRKGKKKEKKRGKKDNRQKAIGLLLAVAFLGQLVIGVIHTSIHVTCITPFKALTYRIETKYELIKQFYFSYI